jgi:spore maturation protein CgeB
LSCKNTLPRDIDISVFFPPSGASSVRAISGKMAIFVKNANWPKGSTIHVGVIGNDGATGRNSIQEPYYTMMSRSKIVITCNPDNWEGDYRLFEALSSGALVVSDYMITPVKHPFIDKEHILYYDRNNFSGLKEIVEYYLAHDDERKKIAQNGYTHAHTYHTASDRIQEILEECVENPLTLRSRAGRAGRAE